MCCIPRKEPEENNQRNRKKYQSRQKKWFFFVEAWNVEAKPPCSSSDVSKPNFIKSYQTCNATCMPCWPSLQQGNASERYYRISCAQTLLLLSSTLDHTRLLLLVWLASFYTNCLFRQSSGFSLWRVTASLLTKLKVKKWNEAFRAWGLWNYKPLIFIHHTMHIMIKLKSVWRVSNTCIFQLSCKERWQNDDGRCDDWQMNDPWK